MVSYDTYMYKEVAKLYNIYKTYLQFTHMKTSYII